MIFTLFGGIEFPFNDWLCEFLDPSSCGILVLNTPLHHASANLRFFLFCVFSSNSSTLKNTLLFTTFLPWQAFFMRWRRIIETCQQRGIFCSICLFFSFESHEVGAFLKTILEKIVTDSLRMKNKLTVACDVCVFHKLKRFGINLEVNYIHIHKSGVSGIQQTVKHHGGILALTGRSIHRPQMRPQICSLLNDLSRCVTLSPVVEFALILHCAAVYLEEPE